MESIRFKGSHQSIDALTLSVTDHKIAFPSSAIADNSKIKFPRSFGDMLPLFFCFVQWRPYFFFKEVVHYFRFNWANVHLRELFCTLKPVQAGV